MIHHYFFPTPNGYKGLIFLIEASLPYENHIVDIRKGDQFEKDFLRFSPNNKMPAIIDDEPIIGDKPIAVFESGAILEYLADKTEKFLPPLGDPQRYNVLKWLYWQMAGLGPMAGQNHHFSIYADEKILYAIKRYQDETARLYKVLSNQLKCHDYVAGKNYSIADMACYPWIKLHERQNQDLNDFPALKRWFETVAQREAVKQAYAIGAALQDGLPTINEESKKILFGQSAASLQSNDDA